MTLDEFFKEWRMCRGGKLEADIRGMLAAKDAEIKNLKSTVARLQGQHEPDCEIRENESMRTERIGMCDCGYVERELAKLREQRDRLLLEQYRMGMASALYRMSRADAERSMAEALKREFGVRIIDGKVEEIARDGK